MTICRRVAKGLNSTKTSAVPDKIWTVTEAVQAILLIQTNCLLRRGVPQQLRKVVGNLWFRFLAKIGTISVPEIEPVVLTAVYKISIFDNLAILYLSLHLLNYPVLCSDILDWIGDGTLSYFNTNRLLPEHFKPKKLLGSSLLVHSLPTLKNIKQRVQIVSEILDDVPKPKVQVSVLESLFKRVRTKFNVTALDIQSLCIGLIKKFYFYYETESQLIANAELVIAACFVTALRLYYQFENPDSPKESWLLWFRPYLQSRHEHFVGYLVDKSILDRHTFVTEKHFLNMPVDEYLNSVEAIIWQSRKVLKHSEFTGEFKRQFTGTMDDESKGYSVPKEDDHCGHRKHKRKSDGLLRNRKIIVYPIDEIIEDSILPLELQLIIEDVAAYFHLTSNSLFFEIQKLGELFDTNSEFRNLSS